MAESKETVFGPSSPSTVNVWGEAKAPVPWTTVTSRRFAIPASPWVSLPTTESFQERRASRSISGSPNRIPRSPISRASSSTLAAWRSAFDGMQPTFRHTPPRSA